MNKLKNCLYCLLLLTLVSCNNHEKIIRLLKSDNADDVIWAATKAGKTGNMKFVPLLLENAEDWRMSTNFSFKGVSVYQAKMGGLKKIFKKAPQGGISYKPDSAVIKFYTALYLKKVNR